MISVTLTFSTGGFNLLLAVSVISCGVWTAAISCLPFSVADAIASDEVASLIFSSCFDLSSSTCFFNASFSLLDNALSSSISAFSASAAFVRSAFALSLSVAFLTGTSISSFDPSGYVTSTTTTFLPAFAPVPSTIAPSFLTCLSVGCGWSFGTSTASVIAFLSVSATFLSVAGSTLTGTSPVVTVGVDLSASVWCTASIAFLPSSVAFATSSGVVALSIFFSCSSLTLSTLSFSAFFWSSVKFLSASISAFSLLAAAVKSAFAFSFALSNSVLCTPSIAFLPASVASATFSGVVAPSILASCSFLTLSTSAFAFSFSSLLSLVSASISSFSLLAASVKSAFAFSLALSNAFSASVFASTVLEAGSSFCDLSE